MGTRSRSARPPTWALAALTFFALIFLFAPPALGEKAKRAAAQAAPRAAQDDKEGDAPKEADAGDAKPEGLKKAKIGIILSSITKFELGPGTYQAEFGVLVTCQAGEPCKPDLEASNGKLSMKELLIDTPELQLYRMRGEFGGNVDLSEYPFDRHELELSLVDKKFKTLLERDDTPDTTKIDADVRIPGWTLRGWDWHSERTEIVPNEMVLSEAGVKVRIERPRLASFFKALMPLTFMILVAGFTLLLKPKSASGRLTAATGALMTLVMFHISSTSSLPPLGYMTRLDKFMVATYFVYMVNVLFAVAMVRLEEAKNEKLSLRVYHLAQGTVPGLALMLTTMVFGRIV